MIRLERLVFACEEPARLAPFWAALLGYGQAGEEVVDPSGEVPPLGFRRAAKTTTIEAPVHLDVNVPDPDAAVSRALELGAWLVAKKTQEIASISESWTVLRDPEGNGFCIQGPDTRRPRPYVGNVTFSCAQPVVLGRFWREALGYQETQLPEELERSLLEARVDPAELEAYADAVHPEGRRPRLLFQRRQKTPAPDPPLRLELAADDVEAHVQRLVALGAERLEPRRAGFELLDPEGNVFTLAAAR